MLCLFLLGCRSEQAFTQREVRATIDSTILLMSDLRAVEPEDQALTSELQPNYTLYPTFTPYPTYTPYPPQLAGTSTVRPDFHRWNASDAIAVFLDSGLVHVEGIRPMVAEDYDLAPKVDVEAIRFFLPGLCELCNGQVMSFDWPAELETVRDYYLVLGARDPSYFSWVFVTDNILVQISGEVSEQQALKFRTALYALG